MDVELPQLRGVGMNKRFSSKSGFTLIEVIVVMLLLGLAVALVLPRGLREATNGAVLDTEAQKLAGVIRLAREKAMSKALSYKITFDDKGYSLFLGDSTNPESTVQTDIHLLLVPSPVLKGGVVFDGSGKVSAPGTIVLQIVGNAAISKKVEINEEGNVDISKF